MALKITNTQHYSDIADAIREKAGTQDTYTPGQMAQAIKDIPSGGGGSVESNDVNFYDYTGDLVASYSAEEFLELAAMPDNPEHDGLTAQGWNWTLADAKEYVQAYGMLDIGQMYITSDGKTRMDIELDTSLKISVEFYYYGPVTVNFDWGDGNSDTDIPTITSDEWRFGSESHTYAEPGKYTVTIEVSEESAGKILFGKTSAPSFSDNVEYCRLLTGSRPYDAGPLFDAVKTIFVGRKTIVGNSAFRGLTSLMYATVPENSLYTSFAQAFRECSALKHFTVPATEEDVTSNDTFMTASNLRSVSTSKNVIYGRGDISAGAFFSAPISRLTLPIKSNIDIANVGGKGTIVEASIPGLPNIPSFFSNSGFKRVMMGNALKFAGTSTFSKTALKKLVIPDTIPGITSYLCQNCYYLREVVIGAGVTSIGTSAFGSCYALNSIHFRASQPPKATNSNIWAGIPSKCKIYVPAGTLAAYTSATNYPDPATYTYLEE